MTPPATARTLADALRAMTAGDLATLLSARPDLAVPPPPDIADLAARATSATSVMRAVDALDAWQLAVLEVVAVLGADYNATDAADLLEADPAPVSEAIARLRSHALVWGTDEAPRLPVAVRAIFEPWPGGLAEPSEQPWSAEAISAALATLPGESVAPVLDLLGWGPPQGAVRDATREVTPATASSPVEHLLAAGLLRPVDASTVVLPREVALHVRQGRLRREPVRSIPPTFEPGPRTEALINNTGVGAAFQFCHHVDVALDELSRLRPQPLRSGAVSKRDLTHIGRALDDRELTLTGCVVDVATSAGLMATDGARVVAPTRAYDAWLAMDGPDRWTLLVDAWRDLHPHVAPALDDAPVGALIHAAALEARVRWRHPRWRGPADGAIGDAVAQVIEQATLLGLVSLGQRTRLAERPLPDDVQAMFPAAVETLVIQSDLTAISPGPLTHDARGVLRLLAAHESHGGSDVYRFSARSLQPAFDAGWSVDAIRDWLDEHSTTGVPQPLHYLLDDVARRHGTLRLSAISTLLRADNPADAATIAGHPGAAGLGLREVAPGVLVADSEPHEVASFVSSLGFTPAAEDASGTLVVAPRTPRLPARPAAPAASLDHDDVERIVGRLTAPRPAHHDTHDVLLLLGRAIADGSPVDLEYVAADGSRRRVRARPQQISAGGVRVLVDGSPLFVPLGRVVRAGTATEPSTASGPA